MSWDAIAAAAEVAGALGVTVSLLYLAVQVRHGAKNAEDVATRDVFSATCEYLAKMAEEPNRSILLKGLLGYRDLPGEEKFAFDALLGSLIVFVEASCISNNASLLSDDSMENWGCYLRKRYFAYPRVREWWADARGIVVPSAQAWIDSEIARAGVDDDFWGIKHA